MSNNIMQILEQATKHTRYESSHNQLLENAEESIKQAISSNDAQNIHKLISTNTRYANELDATN